MSRLVKLWAVRHFRTRSHFPSNKKTLALRQVSRLLEECFESSDACSCLSSSVICRHKEFFTIKRCMLVSVHKTLSNFDKCIIIIIIILGRLRYFFFREYARISVCPLDLRIDNLWVMNDRRLMRFMFFTESRLSS